MYKSVTLDYDFEAFLKADYSGTPHSCIKHQTTELTDIHDRYGGMPKSFNQYNTGIHQLWWSPDDVDYDELGKKLGMEVISVSTIMQEPGNMIPLHRDMFYQITSKYPDDTRTKVRANIYLEDWKLGHFLQYGNTVSTHWSRGEGHMWDSAVEHTSANSGMEDKYTLQVSGFLLDS